MPAVSVVIPARNRADLIGETLASVSAQTLEDWECIVVDDGSTDDTAAVVRSAAGDDARFRVLSARFGSASAARNAGVAEASATYLSFLDSDDLMVPDKLARQVAALDADPDAVLAYGDTVQFRTGERPEHGTIYMSEVERPTDFESLLSFSAIYAPTVRTSAFHAAGGFDTSLASAEDWDMWLALARSGRLLYLPGPALHYRIHPGNKSRHTLRNLACATRVARKHLANLPLGRRARVAARVWRYFARVYPTPLFHDAAAARAGCDARSARVRLAAAALLRPRWFVRYPSTMLGLFGLKGASR